MGDKEDGLALGGERAHDLHQFVDLLRREHGRRLVKYKDLVVAVEHLEDLHALLHAHGYIFDQGVGVDAHPVFFAQCKNFFARGVLFEKAHVGVFRAEDDVVQYRKDFDQLKVLMHHADAQRRGVVGVVDSDLLPVFADNAALGLIEAEKDAHQRRFARAVFAQQGVYFALFELEGHVIVGLDPGKFLGDAQHLDHIIAHPISPLYRYTVKGLSPKRQPP